MTTLEKIIRWTLVAVIILALILVPFFLFGTPIEHWTESFLTRANENKLLTGAILWALLATDVLLPIPSSVVSTASGAFLGWIIGFFVSLTGMTVSSYIGYILGLRVGRDGTEKLVGQDELERLTTVSQRYGDWVIAIFRAVPVLAEASTYFAGITRMPLKRFLWIAILANSGVSAVYATVGAYAATVDSFLLAFFGSMSIPGIALLFSRWRRAVLSF